MDEIQVLGLIHQALRQANLPEINDVTLDGDSNSAEIILTVDDGKEKTDWVIHAKDITPADRAWDTCAECHQEIGQLHKPECGKRVVDCPHVVLDDCHEEE